MSNPVQCNVFSNDFLRERPRENPIFTDIKVVLTVMQVTGIFPIFVRITHYKIGPPTRFYEYYAIFVRGTLQACSAWYLYISFATDTMQWSYSNHDSDIGQKLIDLVLSVIATSATVLFAGLNSQRFLEIINEILQVDKELYEKFRETPKNHCDFSTKYLIGIGIWQMYVIASKLFFETMQRNPTSFAVLGFFLVKNGILTAFMIFLAALLRIIAMRFAYLNFLLTRYTYRKQCSIIGSRSQNLFLDKMISSEETFPENTQFIFRMHSRLLRIYKSTNECCSLMVLCYMGYDFYTLTENTYYLFVETTTRYLYDISAEVILWGVAWLLLHVSLFRLFCRCCDQITQEANIIKLLLARIYRSKKEHQHIIDKFLIKSIKQKTQFTVYGFFTIDVSTLFKIFTAVTTYLVIFIQFKQLEDAKLANEITPGNERDH